MQFLATQQRGSANGWTKARSPTCPTGGGPDIGQELNDIPQPVQTTVAHPAPAKRTQDPCFVAPSLAPTKRLEALKGVILAPLIR